ncbi:MAG: DNA repair exonuclease [Chloroflexi bacterium]|nr:DNA repair exonuclease [Chloroflexota bacterium]
MKPFRFLHIADLHLDANPGKGKLHLPAGKRVIVRDRIKAAMRKLPDLIREKNLEAVLIPGDLFDREPTDPDILSFTIDIMGQVSPVPVFLLPGNHDSYIPRGNYDKDWLMIRHGVSWPDNVYIFNSEEFSTVPVPGRDDVTITGALTPAGAAAHRLSKKLPVEPGKLNILLFHGACVDGGLPDMPAADPFNTAELLSQDFDYTALGHYHSFRQFTDGEGKIRAAYSGTPWGQNLDESGEKYALSVELSYDEARLEKLKVIDYAIRDKTLDITGIKHRDALMDKILETIRSEHGKNDIFYVRLKGIIPPTLSVSGMDIDIRDECFHLFIDDSGVLPDYDIDRLSTEGTLLEKEFIRAMKARLDESLDKAGILTNALYYGLDALRGREVTPR